MSFACEPRNVCWGPLGSWLHCLLTLTLTLTLSKTETDIFIVGMSDGHLLVDVNCDEIEFSCHDNDSMSVIHSFETTL